MQFVNKADLDGKSNRGLLHTCQFFIYQKISSYTFIKPSFSLDASKKG